MAVSGPSKKWATEPDWDKHRATITRLYSHENRTLLQLIEIMDRQYNFHATSKMYKSRFKRWGLAKYNKSTPSSSHTAATDNTASKPGREQEDKDPPAANTTTTAEVVVEIIRLPHQHPHRYQHEYQQPQQQQQEQEQPLQKQPLQQQQQQQQQQQVVVNLAATYDGKPDVAAPAHRTAAYTRRRPRVRANASSSAVAVAVAVAGGSTKTKKTSVSPSDPRYTQLCRYHAWVSSGGVSRPTHLRGPAPLQQEEDMFRAIRDYYDGSFLAGRWTTVRPSYSYQYRPPCLENGRSSSNDGSGAMAIVVRDTVETSRKQLLDLHSRFRIAMNMLIEHQQLQQQQQQLQLQMEANSPKGGSDSQGRGSNSASPPPAPITSPPAEGIKMLRICFAQLPEVLRSEDPALLNYMVDLVRRLREGGLEFVENLLLRHLHGLATAGVSTLMGTEWGKAETDETERHSVPPSIWLLWRVLRSGVPLDRDRAARCAEVVADQFARYLGPLHMQTVELLEWWIVNREATVEGRERGMRALYARLATEMAEEEDNAIIDDVSSISGRSTTSGTSSSSSSGSSTSSIPAFDRRHLDVLMNLANLLRRNDRIAETAELLSTVLDVPAREQVLRQHPPTAYNFYWLLGKVRSREGRHWEAERHIREALAIAYGIEDTGGSEYLSALVALEQCLRDQGRDGEADVVLAGRQDLIRKKLEEVGEKENAV